MVEPANIARDRGPCAAGISIDAMNGNNTGFGYFVSQIMGVKLWHNLLTRLRRPTEDNRAPQCRKAAFLSFPIGIY